MLPVSGDDVVALVMVGGAVALVTVGGAVALVMAGGAVVGVRVPVGKDHSPARYTDVHVIHETRVANGGRGRGRGRGHVLHPLTYVFRSGTVC